jgi:hypothetical protein
LLVFFGFFLAEYRRSRSYAEHYEGVEHQFMNGSSAIQSANGRAMAFTTTHWSVVLEAQGDPPL